MLNWGNAWSALWGGSQSNGAKSNSGLAQYSPVTVSDHRSLRQQARAKVKDSTIAKGILERTVELAIGDGLKVDPSPVASILGITDEFKEEWANDVKLKYNLYAQDKKFTLNEGANLYQFHRQKLFGELRDGETFIRNHYSKRKDLLNPLQVSLIDPEQIRYDAITTSLGPFAQDDGIIRDSSGKETGYKIWVQDQSKPFKLKYVEVPRKSAKTGRIMMSHNFTPEYAGQGRGITKLQGILQELENITSYQLATLDKAAAMALSVGAVVPSKDAPATNVFKNITGGGIGQPANQVTEDTSEEPFGFGYHPLKEGTVNSSGMFIANLGAGEDMKFFTQTMSGESHAQFQDAVVEYLAPSVGMPIEVLKMKFGGSFSAANASFILLWIIVEMIRGNEEANFLNPNYEMWMSGEIAAGRISAPGWSDPIKKSAWLNCNWVGNPKPVIDPVKTSVANMNNMVMDLTNPERAAQELNGSDAKVNKAKNDRHFKDGQLKPWTTAFVEELKLAMMEGEDASES